MENKEPQINQSIEGTGNAQAAGQNNTAISFFGIPLEQLMMIEVVSLIIIQCLVAPCSVAVFWLLPLIFGLPAIHSLITGISLKNKKIIILSIVSGLMSLFWLVALIAYGFLLQLNNQLGGQ